MQKQPRVLGLGILVAISALIAVGWLVYGNSLVSPRRSSPNFNSLHEAVVFDPTQIQRLVDAGADIDEIDANGHTALWIASRRNKVNAVRDLLSLGADPNESGPDWDTPLLIATQVNSDTPIAELLIAASADVNVVDQRYGQTPLHYAVRENNREVVRLLLHSGANSNARSSSGDTPLQFAVAKGYPDIVELLLNSGADPELRNAAGIRPIDQLNACPDPEQVARVFRAHGADDERRPELFAAARARSKD